MSKDRGFLEYERKDPTYRPVEERIHDYKWVELPLTDHEIHEQAARCMDCGIPFCHGAASGCSLCNVIPEFNEHVYYGRWKEALDILLSTNSFPEFTGRICPAPCEGACVLGLIQPPVAICKIELSIIEQGFQRGYVKPRPPAVRRKERVAVVGSGPAGLGAADVLNKMGFRVVVYENAAKPGGLLRYGIPDFKLEKWVIDRRIDLMRNEGIVFETGVEIGEDISYRFLEKRFDAVVLAGGAREPRDLKVPGRELEGIHFAMEFLTQQNKLNGGEEVPEAERISAEGKNVVVIGGGDTGSDCIGTSRRHGAKDIVQLEILPEPPPTRSEKTPWPQWPIQRRDSSSHKEGAERRWSITTKEVIGDNGRVKQLRCAELEWKEPEGGGRPTPVEKPNSEFILEADLVLLAMGFVGPGENTLVDDLNLERTERGFLKRDERNMTSKPGVFVTGDMERGASLVVHAISDGMETARKIQTYLDERAGE
jgi:glutamate synthase (NADPH/NADH) small chain